MSLRSGRFSAGLVLVADERQVAVERVARPVHLAGAEVAVDGDQDLGEAEAGHHAHRAALQLLEHEVAAQAAEDADVRGWPRGWP